VYDIVEECEERSWIITNSIQICVSIGKEPICVLRYVEVDISYIMSKCNEI